MSEKTIKTRNGEVSINDTCGGPLMISVDNGDHCTGLGITAEDARKIARALDAFAEIHS